MGNICQTDTTEQAHFGVAGVKLTTTVKIKNQPPSSYAYLTQRPQLHINVHNTLQRQMAVKKLSSRAKQIQQTQFFYIPSKGTYYLGPFNEKFLPHGLGLAIFPDGTYYQGQFINGQANDDNALILFPNGSYYSGNVSRSALQGSGKLIHPHVYQYHGQWRDNQPFGDGEEKYYNQSQQRQAQYDGKFVDGRKNGDGNYTYGKSKYIGAFQHGLMHDKQGKIQTKNMGTQDQGINYKGPFFKGQKTGKGIVQTAHGELEGNFVNDQLEGDGKFKWKDGKIYQGQFKNSQFHGKGKIIYPNHSQVEGQWKQNHNHIITKVKA